MFNTRIHQHSVNGMLNQVSCEAIMYLGNGQLLSFLKDQTGESVLDGKAYTVRSSDFGTTWDAPVLFMDPAGAYNFNTTWLLYVGTDLWLFYQKKTTTNNTINDIYYRISTNNGTSWSAETQIVAPHSYNIIGRPIVMSNGNILIPYAYNRGAQNSPAVNDGYYRIATMIYNGSSWVPGGSIPDPVPDQTRGLLEPQSVIASGTLYMFMRSTSGFVWYTTSADNGQSWEIAKWTKHVSTDGLAAVFTMNDGRFAMVNHAYYAIDSVQRRPLNLLVGKHGAPLDFSFAVTKIVDSPTYVNDDKYVAHQVGMVREEGPWKDYIYGVYWHHRPFDTPKTVEPWFFRVHESELEASPVQTAEGNLWIDGFNTAAPTAQTPSWVGAGTFAGSASTATPGIPPGTAANHIMLLFVETENEIVTAPTGWTQVVGPSGLGTAGSTTAVRLTVFWKRATASETAPTIADAGDHVAAIIHTFSGCRTSGNPWDVALAGNKNSSTTGSSIPTVTTTVGNALIVGGEARATDTLTAQYSNPTNASLTNLAERSDNSTDAGTGGGLAVVTGEKASAGATGAISGTLATASLESYVTIALVGDSKVGRSSLYTVTGTDSWTGSGLVRQWPTANGERVIESVNVGQADMSVYAIIKNNSTTTNTAPGLVARMTDLDNNFKIDILNNANLRLIEYSTTAGVTVPINVVQSTTVGQNYFYFLDCQGTTIRYIRNGTLIGTHTSSNNSTGTRAGIIAYASAVDFDNFIVMKNMNLKVHGLHPGMAVRLFRDNNDATSLLVRSAVEVNGTATLNIYYPLAEGDGTTIVTPPLRLFFQVYTNNTYSTPVPHGRFPQAGYTWDIFGGDEYTMWPLVREYPVAGFFGT